MMCTVSELFATQFNHVRVKVFEDAEFTTESMSQILGIDFERVEESIITIANENQHGFSQSEFLKGLWSFYRIEEAPVSLAPSVVRIDPDTEITISVSYDVSVKEMSGAPASLVPEGASLINFDSVLIEKSNSTWTLYLNRLKNEGIIMAVGGFSDTYNGEKALFTITFYIDINDEYKIIKEYMEAFQALISDGVPAYPQISEVEKNRNRKKGSRSGDRIRDRRNGYRKYKEIE